MVGGGAVSRNHIKFARRFGLSDNDLHEVGIKATLLNAFIISRAVGADFYEGDPRLLKPTRNIVTGGFKEGWTTDICAAYAAVAVKSDVLFNLSKEDGVYNKDPSKYANAKKLDFLSFERLYNLAKGERKPGMNFIFDPEATLICQKNKISIVVTSNILDIEAFLEGGKISGTLVR